MGDYVEYQTLEQRDILSVVLYRLGIGCAAVALGVLALLSTPGLLPDSSLFRLEVLGQEQGPGGYQTASWLLLGLVVAVGASVFTIHLYDGRLVRYLKTLYGLALLAFLCLVGLGGGSPSLGLVSAWYGPILLLPLAGCLAFIGAKEAFCFGLFEGYLLAVLLPGYLLVASTGGLTVSAAAAGIWAISAVLGFFAVRKAFMPMHCDIGDKSAYR